MSNNPGAELYCLKSLGSILKSTSLCEYMKIKVT